VKFKVKLKKNLGVNQGSRLGVEVGAGVGQRPARGRGNGPGPAGTVGGRGPTLGVALIAMDHLMGTDRRRQWCRHLGSGQLGVAG
jgi:hypothetical protein